MDMSAHGQRRSVIWKGGTVAAMMSTLALAGSPGGSGTKWTLTAPDPNDNVTAVRVAGSGYQMGWWYGYLLAPAIRANLNKLVAWTGMTEADLTAYVDAQLWPRMAPHVPQAFLEEMQGIVDGASEATPPASPPLSAAEIRLMIVMAEIVGLECTSVVAVRSATWDGRLIQIRVLDTELGTRCQDNPVITVYCPTDGPAYCNVGFAGLIGSLAGMNGEGVALSEVGLHTPNVSPFNPDTLEVYAGIPMTLLMKKILAQAHAGEGRSALDRAIDIIQTGPRTTNYGYGVGDGAIRDGRTFATSRLLCNAWGPGTAATLHHPEDPNTRWIFDPNRYAGLPAFSGCDDVMPALPDVTYMPSDTNKLLDLMTPGGPNYVGPLDPNRAMTVARRMAMSSNLMDVVFDGQDLKLWVAYAQGQQSASRRAFVPFDFGAVVPTYRLALTTVNNSWGTVEIDPNREQYRSGTEVGLTAVPVEGKAFSRWLIYDPNYLGDANHAVEDANTVLHLLMNADRDVEAGFRCGSGLVPLVPLGLALVWMSWHVPRHRPTTIRRVPTTFDACRRKDADK
jgi:hypothetical protein